MSRASSREECGSRGNRWVKGRKQREQAGEGPEAEGRAQVKGRKESGTVWEPESDEPAIASG